MYYTPVASSYAGGVLKESQLSVRRSLIKCIEVKATFC